ncbi:MAG: type 1 glutamine amidotransferase [Bacteroidales bacterium]|nr:type 1 glutamine amidotransferase [Bacteroidales bacterium]
MMEDKLKGKKIAFLVENGFEEEELTRPRKALAEMGAVTHIVSPQKGKVKAWDHTNWGGEYEVDVSLEQANPDDYDILVLPGGVINPDKLRRNKSAVEFAGKFFNDDKIVAAICHGPQLLIEGDFVKGRHMTSFPSIRKDLSNAGADWEDKEVITDGNLITSRKPDDIPAFNNRIAEMVSN